MKRIIVLLTFIGISSNLMFSQSQKDFFVDDKNDYVLLLDNNVKTSTKNLDNGEIDMYSKVDNNKFEYTLLIFKITDHEFKNGNLLDGKYETYYEETCGCKISDIDLAIYNNVKPLRHFIKVEKGKDKFNGINASFVSGEYLYKILFLTFEKNNEHLKASFAEIMNTLIVNGKTTINNYSE